MLVYFVADNVNTFLSVEPYDCFSAFFLSLKYFYVWGFIYYYMFILETY